MKKNYLSQKTSRFRGIEKASLKNIYIQTYKTLSTLRNVETAEPIRLTGMAYSRSNLKVFTYNFFKILDIFRFAKLN